MVFDRQVGIVPLGQLDFRLELFQEGFHLGGQVGDLTVARLADGHAAAGLAQQLRVFRIADRVATEAAQAEAVFGQKVLEPLAPQPLPDLLQVRAGEGRIPEIDGLEAQRGNSLAGLFDPQRAELDAGSRTGAWSTARAPRCRRPAVRRPRVRKWPPPARRPTPPETYADAESIGIAWFSPEDVLWCRRVTCGSSRTALRLAGIQCTKPEARLASGEAKDVPTNAPTVSANPPAVYSPAPSGRTSRQ